MGIRARIAIALAASTCLSFVTDKQWQLFASQGDSAHSLLEWVLQKKDDRCVLVTPEMRPCTASTDDKNDARRRDQEPATDLIAFQIDCPSGIGSIKMERKGAFWPKHLHFHLKLQGLEHLSLASDSKLICTVSVSSSQTNSPENMPVIAWEKGKQPLKKVDRENWITIKRHLPPKKLDAPALSEPHSENQDVGWDVCIDNELLEDSKAIELKWIDFYR